MIQIEKYPTLLSVINKELTSGNIVEIKVERDSITAVRIDRKVRDKTALKEM